MLPCHWLTCFAYQSLDGPMMVLALLTPPTAEKVRVPFIPAMA